MPTCIYCGFSSPEKFPREHVIPQAFGSFQNNLTIGCVCAECNRYFGKHLEMPFATESVESIVRYRHGLRDLESAKRTRTVRARANVPGPIQGAKVLLRPDSSAKSGIGHEYLLQVGIKNPNEADWRFYTLEELNAEIVETLEPGAGLKLFVTIEGAAEQGEEAIRSKLRQQEAKIRSKLRELGFVGETQEISRDRVLPTKNSIARVACEFNFDMSRCVAKISFNYLAYMLGENTDVLLRHNFDAIRKYVRHGIFPEYAVVSCSNKPKFSQERETPSFVNGHIIVAGWDMTNGNIVCALRTFDGAMSYRVLLCLKYDGLWFALRSAHAFDFDSGDVRSIPVDLLPGRIAV